MFFSTWWYSITLICELMLIFFLCINQNPDHRLRSQGEASGRVSYGSVLMNVGKCLLLIIIIPPFLNYASLQREGQMLLPKGQKLLQYLNQWLKQKYQYHCVLQVFNIFYYCMLISLWEIVSRLCHQVLKAELKLIYSVSIPPLSYVGGQLVDVGLGQKMHLLCKGHGKPVGNASYKDNLWCTINDFLRSAKKTFLAHDFISVF